MRNTRDTLDWLKTHETTEQLGYNPDGRCLQIAREARDLDSLYPSAYAAMLATPLEYRVEDISEVVRGMVGYFDDPRDDNPFGHVVTWLGWEKGAPHNNLHNLFCKTNAVVSGRTVVVRGDYFQQHWGDPYVFSATWLNGHVLDLPNRKTQPDPKPKPPVGKYGKRKLQEIVYELDRLIEIQKEQGHTRAVRALRRDKREVLETLEKLT